MQNSPRVVALMGSYHKHGNLAQAVEGVLEGARSEGASTETLVLSEHHLEFCQNCRQCCQPPGPERGPCPIDDDLNAVLGPLEEADAIVLGSPVNFGDANAMTRQLLERMVGYAHWPMGAPAPKLRRSGQNRAAILVTSSAAPGFLTRIAARPLRTLREMAKLLGAKPAGTLVVGLAGNKRPQIPERAQRRAQALGKKLVARAMG